MSSRPREAGNLKKSAMSAAVRERTTTHTSRKIVSHGGPISGQSQSTTTANSLENNLGKSLNVPPERCNPIHLARSFSTNLLHVSYVRFDELIRSPPMYSNVLETKLDRHLNEIALSNSDFLRYRMEEWSISFLELHRKYKQYNNFKLRHYV